MTYYLDSIRSLITSWSEIPTRVHLKQLIITLHSTILRLRYSVTLLLLADNQNLSALSSPIRSGCCTHLVPLEPPKGSSRVKVAPYWKSRNPLACTTKYRRARPSIFRRRPRGCYGTCWLGS